MGKPARLQLGSGMLASLFYFLIDDLGLGVNRD